LPSPNHFRFQLLPQLRQVLLDLRKLFSANQNIDDASVLRRKEMALTDQLEHDESSLGKEVLMKWIDDKIY
jgi:hypothetical protein